MLAFFYNFHVLQVQWDEAAGIERPERVSPWEIEPFDATVLVPNVPQPAVVKCKRSRQPSDTADLSVLGREERLSQILYI